MTVGRSLAVGANGTIVVKDAVQTLVSVNNIDQSVFQIGDKATTTKYWNAVFLQNSVSEDIFDAIASKSGTSAATREKVSAPGNYFCLNKQDFMLTNLFYLIRLHGPKSLGISFWTRPT